MCDRCAILLFICMMKHYVSVLGPISPIGFPAPFAIWMLLSMTIAVLLHVHVCSICHAIIYYCTLHWYHIAINLIWFDLIWYHYRCHLPFAFRTLMEAVRELCLYKYKLRDALIAGPVQWGIRDQNTTCFVWNALTVVFISVFWSCSSQ